MKNAGSRSSFQKLNLTAWNVHDFYIDVYAFLLGKVGVLVILDEWKVPYLGVDFGRFLLLCLLTSLFLLGGRWWLLLVASNLWKC